MHRMLAFRPSSGHRSADAYVAGVQANEWPREGQLMLMMLGRVRPIEWPREGRLMLMLLAFGPSSGHRSVG